MENVAMINSNTKGGKLTGKVGVAKDASVLHLKNLIEVIMGVKAERQTLQFNGEELDDTKTVESHNLTGGDSDTLSLIMTPLDGNAEFSIKLKSESKEETVEVRENYLVGELRAKIGRQWGFLYDEIMLVHGGQEMEDVFPLSAYLICEGSVVEANLIINPR